MIDSLLQQHAQSGQAADEDFLSHMESVIDGDKVVPIQKEKTKSLLRKITTIAACLAVIGLIISLSTPRYSHVKRTKEITYNAYRSSPQFERPGIEDKLETLTQNRRSTPYPSGDVSVVAGGEISINGKPFPADGMIQSDSVDDFDLLATVSQKPASSTSLIDGAVPVTVGADIPLDTSSSSRIGGAVEVKNQSVWFTGSPSGLQEAEYGLRKKMNSAGKVSFSDRLASLNDRSDFTITTGRSPAIEIRPLGKPIEVEVNSVPRNQGSPKYGSLIDHSWASPIKAPLSTFSIDVDTASWTNVRGMIRRGFSVDQIPNDSVRIEEWINYFDWDYPQPDGEHPFAFATEVAQSPWDADNLLLRIGVKGEELSRVDRPSANLTFLLDISGSMNQPNKLGYVKKTIAMLTEELNENDCVSIVVYAGAEGVALEPTPGNEQVKILKTLDNLRSGGSTNGGAGIKLAYRFARDNFIEDGINRVILCTDGDFNVGVTNNEALVDLVESQAKDEVFLSVCGFGNDNLNDHMLEAITNKGNGNYFFIDTEREARKVFLEDLMGTLTTIAKDVKIQVEFNPAQVASYRLIGYANRKLRPEDFKNDAVDAGEVGSGHSVTALYELIPVGSKNDPAIAADSELRYQKSDVPKRKLVPSKELALLKLRYKRPNEAKSVPMQQPIMPSTQSWEKAGKDFRFAAAIAMVGMKIRDHESMKDSSIKEAAKIAKDAIGQDIHGYQAEFVELIEKLK